MIAHEVVKVAAAAGGKFPSDGVRAVRSFGEDFSIWPRVSLPLVDPPPLPQTWGQDALGAFALPAGCGIAALPREIAAWGCAGRSEPFAPRV